jgi:hypothetical protein
LEIKRKGAKMRRKPVSIETPTNLYQEFIKLKLKDAIYTALTEYTRRPRKINRNELVNEIMRLQQDINKREQKIKEINLYEYVNKVIDDILLKNEFPF